MICDDDEEKCCTTRSGRKLMPSRKYEGECFPSRRKTRLESRKRIVHLEDSHSENDSFESAEDVKATLFEEDLDVEGKKLFSFTTPKKKDGMALAAMTTPKTPKTPREETKEQKTPNSVKKKRQQVAPKTPHHVRNKVKKELAKLIQSSSSSDFSADDSDYVPRLSEEEQSSCNDTQSDDSSKIQTPKTLHRAFTSLPSKSLTDYKKSINKAADYIPQSDCYFTSHSNSKNTTSDHTLDRLKNPRLQADHLFNLLESLKLSSEHEKAISRLIEEYKGYFPKWMYILNEGYNILLHGLGSKRKLLEIFHKEILAEQIVLVVNGFFPSITIKEIVDNIALNILSLNSVPVNLNEAVDIVEEELQLIPETHLYLIVHNLDGATLRNSKAQEVLSRLAKIRNVHLLASIDHINTPLLWDHTKLSNYNFSWWDVTTMLPYTEETGFENSLLVQNSGELALSSLRNVFQSLTANARGVYKLIAKYQLKNKDNHNYQGIPFKDLYTECRETFLVSSDLALRAQLTEFLDHKLVKSKRSIEGVECLYIPIDSSLLQQFTTEIK